nr:hypothetical protein [uncultured Methanobrevibacter sp.]
MTGKRYYEKRYGEEFYILDSNIISEKDFEDKLEIQGYKAFEDSLTGKEIVNKINMQDEIIKYLLCVVRNECSAPINKSVLGSVEYIKERYND